MGEMAVFGLLATGLDMQSPGADPGSFPSNNLQGIVLQGKLSQFMAEFLLGESKTEKGGKGHIPADPRKTIEI
jgi:hypothetical protein